MKLREAIKHAREVAQDENTCPGCRRDHDQLAKWLEELQECRKLIKKLKGVVQENEIIAKPIWETLAEISR